MTARRVRLRYWGAADTGRRAPGTVESGQTVADWLAAFGPVVAEPHAEERWPDCLVLDDTEFTWTNPIGGDRLRLFSVLAAWGYPADQSRPRLWRLEASPTTTAEAWEGFLGALPGRPSVVVADRDRGIEAGVRRRWGHTVPIHLCEHHLWQSARRALGDDGRASYGDPLGEALLRGVPVPYRVEDVLRPGDRSRKQRS